VASSGGAEDEHWLQPDDYFISDRPYESGRINVSLAKMKTAGTASTKNEAQFFRLSDSKDVWTSNFWKTHPATSADLQIGALVLCFEGNPYGNDRRAPRDKHNARTGGWFMGRLTDTSDLYIGTVMVDRYRCSPKALRATEP
jgi:hypothetical protein